MLVRNDTDYRDRKCFFCGKPGHLAKECRSAAYQKGIGKSVKGDGKKGTQNQEDAQTQKSSEKDKRETKCSQCGKVGHVAKEYRNKEIHEVSTAQNTKREWWCFMMTLLITKKSEKKVEEQFTEQSFGKLLIAVDSGTEVNIMPLKWVTKDMRWVLSPSLT